MKLFDPATMKQKLPGRNIENERFSTKKINFGLSRPIANPKVSRVILIFFCLVFTQTIGVGYRSALKFQFAKSLKADLSVSSAIQVPV